MKYTIVLNQKLLKTLSPSISLEEATILSLLISMCETDNEAIEKQRVDGFTWISYEKIISDLPLLKGKTRSSIVAKIKKLEEYGYIVTLHSYYRGRPRKYIKLTEKTCGLYQDHDAPINLGFYERLIGEGVEMKLAREICSDKKFLEEKGRDVEAALKKKRVTDKASYVCSMYSGWLTMGI